MPMGCGMTCRNVTSSRHTTEINRKFPATFDEEACKWRHLIENCFGKLKQSRGITMRSCKTDQSLKAFLPIDEAIIQIR